MSINITLLRYFIIILLCAWSNFSPAKNDARSLLSFDMQNVRLIDAIHILAQSMHRNVIVSAHVQGMISMQVDQTHPEQAFTALLATQGLAAWRFGSVWYVASQEELTKRKEEGMHFREVNENSEPLLTRVWQVRYAKAEDITHILQEEHDSFLSKRGHARVDTRTNVICVQDTEARLKMVEQMLAHLDVPVKQIRIEARLASVDSDFEHELGIYFSSQSAANENDHGGESMHSQGLNFGRYSIAVAKLAGGTLLDMKLAALEATGHAQLISSPSLFTANQQAATIEAGEEIPYQEVSRSGATAVVFKKAELSLKVIPHIMPGDKVLLQLQVNQDKPSSRMVLGVPTISTRKIVTNVLVKNGKTVVLGGIYESNSEEGEAGLPLIKQIPLLGSLLKQHNTRRSKRELLVFVTPKIIESA